MSSHCYKIYQSQLHTSSIKISGYKHCASIFLAASLMWPDTQLVLHNVPNIADVFYMIKIIEHLGGTVIREKDTLTICSKNSNNYKVPEVYSKPIHGAIYFLPVLLARNKRVELGPCGGCAIGDATVLGQRPIQHMISVLEKFTGRLYRSKEKILGTSLQFKACTIDIMDYSDSTTVLTGPLVSGATKTAILAAMGVSQGKTRIFHPYPKPDVTELLQLMQKVGYLIIYNDQCITIEAPATMPRRVNYYLMSDISQIVTYISLSIYHAIPLTLTHITPMQVRAGLKTELDYLKKIGVRVQFTDQTLSIIPPKILFPLDIEVTSIGIYSDHQPFFALILLNAQGRSCIKEYVWKTRFSYAQELKKLGLQLHIHNDSLILIPSVPCHAHQELYAEDLRAAAVLLIAALKAPGYTFVHGVQHLVRGYDDFLGTLVQLGAKIESR